MVKEKPNIEDAEDDGRNTDRALSGAEANATLPEDIATYKMYRDMVEKGELERVLLKDEKHGKRHMVIKEKDKDGKQGKVLYFEDENMIDALDKYNETFFPSKQNREN